MLHILAIAVKKIIHARIHNLKWSNVDVQQEYALKKGVKLVII